MGSPKQTNRPREKGKGSPGLPRDNAARGEVAKAMAVNCVEQRRKLQGKQNGRCMGMSKGTGAGRGRSKVKL